MILKVNQPNAQIPVSNQQAAGTLRRSPLEGLWADRVVLRGRQTLRSRTSWVGLLLEISLIFPPLFPQVLGQQRAIQTSRSPDNRLSGPASNNCRVTPLSDTHTHTHLYNVLVDKLGQHLQGRGSLCISTNLEDLGIPSIPGFLMGPSSRHPREAQRDLAALETPASLRGGNTHE